MAFHVHVRPQVLLVIHQSKPDFIQFSRNNSPHSLISREVLSKTEQVYLKLLTDLYALPKIANTLLRPPSWFSTIALTFGTVVTHILVNCHVMIFSGCTSIVSHISSTWFSCGPQVKLEFGNVGFSVKVKIGEPK